MEELLSCPGRSTMKLREECQDTLAVSLGHGVVSEAGRLLFTSPLFFILEVIRQRMMSRKKYTSTPIAPLSVSTFLRFADTSVDSFTFEVGGGVGRQEACDSECLGGNMALHLE